MSAAKHVHDAQARANATSFLRTNPGKHSVEEIATHLGVSVRSAGQVLGHMAKNKLIPLPAVSEGKKHYWWVEGTVNNGAPVQQPAVRREAPKKHFSATVSNEEALEILGVVTVFKKGHIDVETFLATIRSIVVHE
jgi:hypothetical protein